MMADWAWTSVTKALPPDNLLVLITVEIGIAEAQKGKTSKSKKQ